MYSSLLCGVTRVWTYNRSMASIHDQGAMNGSKNAGDFTDVERQRTPFRRELEAPKSVSAGV